MRTLKPITRQLVNAEQHIKHLKTASSCPLVRFHVETVPFGVVKAPPSIGVEQRALPVIRHRTVQECVLVGLSNSVDEAQMEREHIYHQLLQHDLATQQLEAHIYRLEQRQEVARQALDSLERLFSSAQNALQEQQLLDADGQFMRYSDSNMEPFQHSTELLRRRNIPRVTRTVNKDMTHLADSFLSALTAAAPYSLKLQPLTQHIRNPEQATTSNSNNHSAASIRTQGDDQKGHV